jgi:mono/diheme cytochrome c family protein
LISTGRWLLDNIYDRKRILFTVRPQKRRQSQAALEWIMRNWRVFAITGIVATCFATTTFTGSVATARDSDESAKQQYEQQIKPLLNQFCSKCHGSKKQEAGLNLLQLSTNLVTGDDGEHWEEVLNQLNVGAMPPEDERQPTNEQRAQLTDWVTGELKYAAQIRRSTGGSNVLRRLTRYEYNNTLRDLLGVDLDFAKDLPPEGAAEEGFKNNSSVLVTSSLHLDYYQRIAQGALTKALVFGERPEPFTFEAEAEDKSKSVGPKRKKKKGETAPPPRKEDPVEGGILLTGARALTYHFKDLPLDGPMRIRILAGAATSSDLLPRLKLDLGYDGGNSARPTKTVAEFDVDATQNKPRWYEFHIRAEEFPLKTLNPSKQQFLSIQNAFDAGTAKISASDIPKLFVDRVEIVSPYYAAWPPKTRTRIVGAGKSSDAKSSRDEASAREVLENFMLRAYRRPPSENEVDRMVKLFKTMRSRRASYEEALTGTLSAVLCAPSFLLFVEPSPEAEDQIKSRKLNDYEIASRLSYFLWSTMPDSTLLTLAAEKNLSDPDTLRLQVRRMLDDPKSQQFVERFSSQWLDLDSLYRIAVNPEFFPRFNDSLKDVMRAETVSFFGKVLSEDLSCLTLLDSDFAMLNGPLAKHYGITGVAGSEIREVKLSPEHRRGGILTQASVLLGNSTGDDSHPVKRGVWLLSRLLGDPPPPPPPAVPTLAEEENKGTRLSLKQKLEAHRTESACMNCHRKIDPWGVAFENYDGIGIWRDTTKGEPVSNATETPSEQLKPVEKEIDPTAENNSKEIDVSTWDRKQLEAAKVAIAEGDTPTVKRLKGSVNATLESLRRPYNHLRRLGPSGATDQHQRFLSYIDLRLPPFNAAVDALLAETGQSREEFMKEFAEANKEILAANRLVRELAMKVSPPTKRNTPNTNKRKNKRPANAVTSKSAVAEVDPRTKLPDDTAIENLKDLQTYLVKHKHNQFAETVVRKVLAYSLGRYLDFADTETVERLTTDFENNGYKLSSLIEEIALSDTFLTK